MVESGAPWLCSPGPGSLRSKAENGSGKQKEAGLYVSEQRAPGGTSTLTKCRQGLGRPVEDSIWGRDD